MTSSTQSDGGGDVTLEMVFVPAIANCDGSLKTW
jgi:hypothetical protein